MSRPATLVDGPEIPTPEEIEMMSEGQREAAVVLVHDEAEKLLHGFVEVINEAGRKATVVLVHNKAEKLRVESFEMMNEDGRRATFVLARNQAGTPLYKIKGNFKKHHPRMPISPDQQSPEQKRRVFALYLAARVLQIQLCDVDDLLRRVCAAESAPHPRVTKDNEKAWLAAVEAEAAAEPNREDRGISTLPTRELARDIRSYKKGCEDPENYRRTVGKWRETREYRNAVAQRRWILLQEKMKPELDGLSFVEKRRRVLATFQELYLDLPSPEETVHELEEHLKKFIPTAD
jgi:hypothetical protein